MELRKEGMDVEFKKIWMSPDTGKKSRYSLGLLGGIVGIVVLMMLLMGGGMLLSFWLDWPRELSAVLLCLAATVLAAWMALRVGWRAARDATIFFLTGDDRLYVLDARYLSGPRHGVVGFAVDSAHIQAFLRRLAKRPFLPARASEILKVERVRENRAYYAIRCQVRHTNGQVLRSTHFLVKGYEDEDLLLWQLERRERWENGLEGSESKTPFYILICALVLGGIICLCVLSHPVLQILPTKLYFPCLGAALVTCFFLTYFVIRWRRGE